MREKKEEEKREPSLLDLTRFALANPEKQIPLFSGPWPKAKEQCKAFDQKLLTARRFTLSDDLVHVAAAFSVSPANVLRRVLSKCRTPFDKIWIEFNERVRMQALQDYGYAQVTSKSAYRLGFLVERVVEREQSTKTLYKAAVVSLLADKDKTYEVDDVGLDGKISIFPLGFKYDLEHTEIEPWMTVDDYYANNYVRNSEKEWPIENYTMSMALSPHYCHMNVNMGLSDELKALDAHVRYCLIGPAVLSFKWFTEREPTDYKFATGINGDWRILIAILAIINSYEIRHESVVRASNKKLIKGRSMPYMDYSTIQLTVPRKKIIRHFLDADYRGLGLPRRLHPVMGHWAYSHLHGSDDCEHHWVLPPPKDEKEESHVYHCLKCDKRRWWRREHMRGDAGIGFKDKDYVLKHNPKEDVPTS